MTPDASTESPFWSWHDVAVFAGLAIPALLAGAVFAQVLGLFSPVLKATRVWLSMGAFYALWFGGLYLLLKTRYDRPFWPSLGWIHPGPAAWLCFLAGPLVALSVGGLGALLRTPLKEMPIEKLLEGPAGVALFGLFSVVLGPVTEELAFRGFLMPLAVRTFGPWPGILVAALPFALLHGPEYAWTWQYVVLIGFAGAVFGAVRHYTRSTLASALIHSTYNLTFFIALVTRVGSNR